MKKVAFFFVLLFSSFLFSQQKDIKVGLVLSGGGAKGAAHIPVIKALEKAGVRIDYIGGTSFGAIMGALYASGYNAHQLDSIVRSTNFENVLTNKILRKNKPFKEKEKEEKYILSLPVKKFKIGIPSAFTYGQGVQNLLTELTKNVNHITDFNKLPIPFLCIATDLENGKQVVLKNGFLPEAVRASGAFPTLIAPVTINKQLLADGGIANNFPVEEVKKMGADVIIGVDIQSSLSTKKNLNSALKILNQIVGFKMYENKEEKEKKVDILLKPNVEKYGVIDFDKIDAIIKQGDSAANSKFDEFLALAKKQTHRKKQKSFPNVDKIHIKAFKIKGSKNHNLHYVKGKLELEKGETITYKKLSESINKLSATNNFTQIQYKIKKEHDGSVLSINLKDNPINTNLNLAVHYDKLHKTGVLVGVSSKNSLLKNDFVSLDVVLGDNIRYDFNYFVDNGLHWSFGINSKFDHFKINAPFLQGVLQEINVNYQELAHQLYAQIFLDRRFALKTGFEHNYYNVYTKTISGLPSDDTDTSTTSTGIKTLYLEKSSYFKAFGEITLDAYDKKYFPKKGLYFNTKSVWYLLSSQNDSFNPFFKISGKIGLAETFYSKLTTLIESEAGVTIGNNNNSFLDYFLGGYGHFQNSNMIPFFGYNYFDASLSASSFLRTTATLRYEMFPKNYISLAVNAARAEDDLFNSGYIFENTKLGYMAGYEVDSFLGPLSIHYAWAPENAKSGYWYFTLGYWF